MVSRHFQGIPLSIVVFLLSIIALIGTVSLTHASNESSYKFGYKVSMDNLTNLITVPNTWDKNTSLSDICDTFDGGCPNYIDAQDNYCLTGQNDKVTNSTSCLDGYIQGFKDWCIGDNYKNARYCALLVASDAIPGYSINDQEENIQELSMMPLTSMLFDSSWNFINESNGRGMLNQGQNIIPGSLLQEEKYTKKILDENKEPFGDMFNIHSPMSFMNNVTNFSGKITFYQSLIKIMASNGLDPTYTSGPIWRLGSNHTLDILGITPLVKSKEDGQDYFYYQTLNFLKISTHLIELQDKHGDTIYLTR